MKTHNNIITQGRRRGRLTIGFIACLLWTVFIPVEGLAVKKTSPLTVDMTFESSAMALNMPEIMVVSVRTTRDMPDILIRIQLPAEIRLVQGTLEWTRDYTVGETYTHRLTVELKETGRYSVDLDFMSHVQLTYPSSGRRHLNIIAGESGVMTGMDPFILLEMSQAETQAEKDTLLGSTGLEDAEISHSGEVSELPEFLEIAVRKALEKSAPAMAPLPGTATVVVSGKVTYKDSAGTSHPVRFAKIEIMDEDGATDGVMGVGMTMLDGTYTVSATGGDDADGPDIKLKVHAAITSDLIASLGSTAANTYFMESAVSENYTDPALTINLTTGAPVSGSTTDPLTPRIFSILDAMLQAGLEAFCLNEEVLLPKISVLFPVGGTVSNYDGTNLNIIRQDALDWDVLFHEYGHYFGDKGSKTKFDNSPGGSHDGGTTIPDNGKGPGVRLAWSEGWATFFGIAIQTHSECNLGIPLPAIPNAGDRRYQDTEDSGIDDDLETLGNGGITGDSQGYASENSIMAALYDLMDSNADTSSDSNAKDVMSATHKVIWDRLNQGAWDDVGKFYGYMATLNASSIEVELQLGSVFAMNNIAPELKTPAEGETLNPEHSPEFMWMANGDPGAAYKHNKFILVIMKNNYAELVTVKDGLSTNKYTFTDLEWEGIVQDAGVKLQWFVLAYNDADPRMPPATTGLGYFLSNAHTFDFGLFSVNGQLGCEGLDAALFFDDLRVGLDGTGFMGSSSGYDYNGTPIYFSITGTYDPGPNWMTVYVDMYYDPAYSSHIRTDLAEGPWSEYYFYDASCELVINTDAGCDPIWFLMYLGNLAPEADDRELDAFMKTLLPYNPELDSNISLAN